MKKINIQSIDHAIRAHSRKKSAIDYDLWFEDLYYDIDNEVMEKARKMQVRRWRHLKNA